MTGAYERQQSTARPADDQEECGQTALRVSRPSGNLFEAPAASLTGAAGLAHANGVPAPQKGPLMPHHGKSAGIVFR